MKKNLLFILVLFTTSSISAVNYFVQLGTVGAATWDAALVAANSGTLVDLTTEAKSFPAWYNATFTTTPAEIAKIYVIEGTYVFTARITYQSSTHIFGGYNGTSLSRTVGTNLWDFADETIFDGNSNTTQFIYAGGSRSNVIFDGLTLQNGGGGATVILRGSEIIRNCKLLNNINNAASGTGAAIYLYGGGNVYNCYFEGNENNGATGNGGDIGITGAGTRVIDANMFVDSYALNKASVLSVSGGCTVKFSNNIIREANGSAAIVINSTSSVKPIVNIINNTFVNNTVQSIYINGDGGYPYLKIYNCVFWAPSTLMGGLGKVSGTADANTIIKNCALMEAHPLSWTSADNFILESTNTGNTPGAKYPAFVDPVNNDFRITASSALRNTGATLDVENLKDFFGSARPDGSNPDIGYFEFDETTTAINIVNTLAIRAFSSNGKLVIENNEQTSALAYVFDITGKLMHQKQLNANETLNFDVSKGSYLIKITSIKGIENIKIFVH